MRVVLFTGKGGVGKTTTAAATALRLAERGVKTLLLSTDTAHSLADALGAPLDGAPREVEPGLWAVQVDTQGRFEAAWQEVRRYLAELAGPGLDPVTAEELTVLPGVDEVLALLAVRDYAATGDWDALVVDCAPTAETLRLLALPEALGWYLERVFPAQRRIARGLRPLTTLLGRADAVPPDSVFDAVARLAADLAAVRTLLGDPVVSSVRLVLTPEAVVVAEARRTFTALALHGYPVDLVVANRVFPDGDDPFLAGWAAAQRGQLAAVRDSFAGLEVREVPFRAGEPVGMDALREVADALYGDRDPAPPGTPIELLRIEAADGGYTLSVALPLADRGEVDAVRVGDDLVLTVGTHRRVLALPDTLRRCTVAGGAYADGWLRVRFRRPAPGGGG